MARPQIHIAAMEGATHSKKNLVASELRARAKDHGRNQVAGRRAKAVIGANVKANQKLEADLEQLKNEHRHCVAGNRRLIALTDAIKNDCDFGGVMRLIRDIVVEDFGMDRAGVFSYDPASETMRGAWGTDANGELQDTSHSRDSFNALDLQRWKSLHAVGHGFLLRHFEEGEERPNFAGDMSQVKDHAVLYLSTANELVGYIAIDNLLTNRPITESQIVEMMPFAEQAAVVMFNVKLRADRGALIQQLRRVLDLTLAITSNDDPENVFLMVRNAIMEIGYFDRAAVFVADESRVHGTWGTDVFGEITDEHHLSFPIDRDGAHFALWSKPDDPYDITDIIVEGPDGERWEQVPFAFIPLRAGGEFVGFVVVDTLLTLRRITSEMVSGVLPITDQAAVAIQKSRSLSQQENAVKQQKRLVDIAVAITASKDLDSIFRMVRDAAMETGTVDRVGAWLIDGDTARGTWGTDSFGHLTDEHEQSFSLAGKDHDFAACMDGEAPFVVDLCHSELLNDGLVSNTPYALIPIRAGKELIGMLSVDMLLTKRKIAPKMVELIVPLAKLAAVAVVKRRLHSAAREEIERRLLAEALLIGQTNELIVARDEALAGTRAKSQFLANMSHEIRTPMNGVIGLNSLMLETPLSHLQRSYASGVQKSAEALLTVIDDVLDLSMLEGGMLKIRSEPFSLRECIKDVAEMIGSVMTTESVKLSWKVPKDFPKLLVGDRDRVRQMVTNLLANAVKFTREGTIVVDASCLAETSARATVRIEVRDTGIGIAPDRQEAVFESFTQADGSSTRRHDGTGLGLTITRQIAELMGGSVNLKSVPDEGTRVWLEIDFAKAMTPSTPLELPLSSRDGPLGLSVLLAEDNPVNAFVTLERLKKWGCVCVGVENGVKALRALEEQHFDLVLMDVSMPELDGIEATHEIRRLENETGFHVPIIALTAHTMQGDRERCLAAGMDDYVSKPVNFRELHKKLQRWGSHICA